MEKLEPINDEIKAILPKRFDEFKKKIRNQNALNRNQLKNSCIDFLNSINLEICVKSLFFDISFYQESYESLRIFQIPVENIFQKVDIDLDKVYQTFVDTNNILVHIEQVARDQNILPYAQNPTSFFWFVTFPNLFGSFLSLESCSDAKYFIENLFEVYKAEKDTNQKFFYSLHVSFAVISFVMHNYLFFDSFQKAFFCELIYKVRNTKNYNTNENEILENQFNSLKNALKASALTFNRYQIQILKIYFETNFQSRQYPKEFQYQYENIIKLVILPAINKWKFSPFLQGNRILFRKLDNKDYFRKLKDYLDPKSNYEAITNLIQPFVDIINEQTFSDEDGLVSFSSLLFEHHSQKILTNLDILLVKEIYQRTQPESNENSSKITSQEIYKEGKKLMFYFQVIDCDPKPAKIIDTPSMIFDQDDSINDILSSSLIPKTSTKEVNERYLSQWLKLNGRIKYGSDYDNMIEYYASLLIQFNKDNVNLVNEEDKKSIDYFINLATAEHDLDIQTRNYISRNLQNFDNTIKMNSIILDEVIVASLSSWIISLSSKIPNLDEYISNLFIESLKDFCTKFEKYDDNDFFDPSTDSKTIDLSNIDNNPKYDFLKLLIEDNDDSNDSEKSRKELDKKRLNNDEFRIGKESCNIFYSFLMNGRTINNKDEIKEIKRAIELLYKLYLDYVRKGLLFASNKEETIILFTDDQFKQFYSKYMNKLFPQNKNPVVDPEFEGTLKEMLPFLSYLLKPMIYDVEEHDNQIKVSLISFESIASLIIKALNIILQNYTEKCSLSSYIFLSAIKLIKKEPIKEKRRKLEGRKKEEEDRRKEEEEKIKIESNEKEKRKMVDEENARRKKEDLKMKEEETAINKEDLEIDQIIIPECEKKLMTFYKFLVNQDSYKNYPELRKLNTYFFK